MSPSASTNGHGRAEYVLVNVAGHTVAVDRRLMPLVDKVVLDMAAAEMDPAGDEPGFGMVGWEGRAVGLLDHLQSVQAADQGLRAASILADAINRCHGPSSSPSGQE
jgi:hypothetical protein